METIYIEATSKRTGPGQYFTFAVSQFTDLERQRRSQITKTTLLPMLMTNYQILHILDMQTGEGAIFRFRGDPEGDRLRHQIKTSPIFPDFLAWLYQQDVSTLSTLPRIVDLDRPQLAERDSRYLRKGTNMIEATGPRHYMPDAGRAGPRCAAIDTRSSRTGRRWPRQPRSQARG
jgi:hypothetical protein